MSDDPLSGLVRAMLHLEHALAEAGFEPDEVALALTPRGLDHFDSLGRMAGPLTVVPTPMKDQRSVAGFRVIPAPRG